MRATDPDGRPVRWVPRDPPAGSLPAETLPVLPRPAINLFEVMPLLNAIRAVLIGAGLAREEEEE